MRFLLLLILVDDTVDGRNPGFRKTHRDEPRKLKLPSLKLTAKAPENTPFQKDISSEPTIYFWGAMLVLGKCQTMVLAEMMSFKKIVDKRTSRRMSSFWAFFDPQKTIDG